MKETNMNIKSLLTEKAYKAMLDAGLPIDSNPTVTQSTKPQFGEYQINGVMGAAKKLKANPRELAKLVIDKLEIDEIADKVELAGPGFINIHLNHTFLETKITRANQGSKLGITPPEKVQKVIVDYSAPNLAKEMHVGHLRSTIIGDSIARTLEFRGNEVIRHNHMGDWGTQFGMLIAHLEQMIAQGVDLEKVALKDLESFYRDAKKRFDNEDGFADIARSYVVKLQAGDKHCKQLWQKFIETSIKHSEEIYERLNVTLNRDHIRAESSYNSLLPTIIQKLNEKGLIVESQGAQVVFIDELANNKGEPSVFIVQKSGGGFLYSTTDLAACEYRSNELQADRILIFTDARQGLHFKQVEVTARKAGLLREETSYEPSLFGAMLGQDGKPFKTRTGGTIKLTSLLDEAVSRASQYLQKRDPNISTDALSEISRKVGIGAVKFADLSKHRSNDYVFDWDSMLSFDAKTAPYLQYAYARIRSIFRKANLSSEELNGKVIISNEQEKELVVKLLQFEEALDLMSNEVTPHVLCNYLYELTSLYMTFYEACPILKEDVKAETRLSRLSICCLVSNTIKIGLDLLGIEVMEKM